MPHAALRGRQNPSTDNTSSLLPIKPTQLLSHETRVKETDQCVPLRNYCRYTHGMLKVQTLNDYSVTAAILFSAMVGGTYLGDRVFVVFAFIDPQLC